ncbi:MAG: hypothetical protein FWE38_04745 [Firmicutes bacterium]|nr:hypothetical protein [Bacillota bacterium]
MAMGAAWSMSRKWNKDFNEQYGTYREPPKIVGVAIGFIFYGVLGLCISTLFLNIPPAFWVIFGICATTTLIGFTLLLIHRLTKNKKPVACSATKKENNSANEIIG